MAEIIGRLAQLVRAFASHAEGQWFKSTSAHKIPSFFLSLGI